MDLREKPGKVQKILELVLRFRLISVLLLVLCSVALVATQWQAMVSLPVAASESLGMWLAEHGGVAGLWQGGQYLAVSAVALVVMLFVFGGIRGGVSGLLGLVAFAGSLMILGGAESMVLIFFGVFTFLALVFLFFVKVGISCALFPFALCWVFLTALVALISGVVPVAPWLLWAVFSAMGFALILAFSLVSAKLLAEGSPRAGAIVRSGKKLLLPVAISSFIALGALILDMDRAALSAGAIAKGVCLWLGFNLWFYGFLFPLVSFAPWDRLRSKERRVKLKEKKK